MINNLTVADSRVYSIELSTKERSDRLMDYFLAAYFIIGLVVANFYDTWLIAFGIGGTCLTAYYSVKTFLPHSNLYQYVLSAVLGVFMAQFIYQMHGMFEMHFFGLIGSTVLITYQKWKLQIPLLIVVFIHHALFGYLQNVGVSYVFFSQPGYFDLLIFTIHMLLTTAIFLICGLWSYQLKKYNEIQIVQTIKMAELEKEAEILLERKKRDDALEERNAILESIADGFFAVDKNWVVTYWNSVAQKMLGVGLKDTIGRNVWEAFPESKELESYYNHHQSKHSQPLHFDTFYPKTSSWYQISAYPSTNGLSVYFHDITARKASEARLLKLSTDIQTQAKELARSNAELEQFAYVASHDLQEPLRMVTSFMSQLESKYADKIDDKGKQYIHFAVDGAQRMRQIILDLLDFSKVGKTHEKLEDINLNELLKDTVKLFNKTIEETNAIIIFDEMPIIKSFKAPIRQVFQNLIANALKYQPKGGVPKIAISVNSTDDALQFSVSDNGIGIDKDDRENIFILFRRLHNKNEYPGTGIGLAVTKKIIENLGGKIWVDSEKRKGSTFHFTISKDVEH